MMSVTTPVPAISQLRENFLQVRQQTQRLCEPLEVEDYVVQSMEDVSPAKWHLAHTTWFFETFVLEPNRTGYRPFDSQFSYLFNSYYNAIGDRQPRGQRGLLSRPPIERVFEYRRYVDEQMLALLDEDVSDDVRDVTVLGLHHEQQHQELFLTDIKHVLWCNPLLPVYSPRESVSSPPTGLSWISHQRSTHMVGHDPDNGFSFDNELPRHEALLHGFEIASRPVTSGEFLEFIADGGYKTAGLWLSEGWDHVRRNDWSGPLYWEQADGRWRTFTLGGLVDVDPVEPVCHVSYFEADAFARWSGLRLPTEFEWEVAAADVKTTTAVASGNFVESNRLHPAPASASEENGSNGRVQQMFGDVWEWTASPYVGYPGYQPASGALGEYNGKFMCNQFVLRGGSCATPRTHIRSTYRNFFQPEKRWQFSGFRLAR